MQKAILALTIILFSLLWSSAFIVGKLALESFDPFSTLTIRFFFSSLSLLCIALYYKQDVFQLKLIKFGFSLGLLHNVLYLGLTFWALLYISPSWVVIIVTCASFMTTLLANIFRIEPFELRKIIGILIGIVGVTFITGIEDINSDQVFGLVLATLGMLSFSIGTVLFRGKATQFDISALNCWLSCCGFIFLLPIAITFGDISPSISNTSIYAMLYLIIVINILCIGLWFYLVRKYGASSASSCFLLNPASGLFLAFIIFGDPISLKDILGAIIIAFGLYIANFSGKTKL